MAEGRTGRKLARAARCSAFLIVLLVSSAAGQSTNSSGTCDNDGPRVFCAYNGVDQGKCEGQYGCCYDDSQPTTVGTGGAPLSIPICFQKAGGDSSYALGGLTNRAGGNGGKLTLTQGTASTLGGDVRALDLTVDNLSPSIVRVRIGASGRWTVPQEDLFLNPGIANGSGAAQIAFNATNSPFGFTITRSSSRDDPLFDTSGHRLVFKDQYIELTTSIPPSSAIYGLGERTPSTGMQLLRQGIPMALWNRDNPAADPDENVYGSHPNYLEIREDGTAHGVVMMNSNGMDVVLTDNTLQFRLIGGIIDLYFLAGPTPNAVNDQLTQIIGRPVMPPYWAMGLMQSKFGYDTSGYFSYVLDNYAAAGIPLETFVADSQYMDRQMIFTLGSNFTISEMDVIIGRLHASGQRFVPILDPFIHLADGYDAYTTGIAEDVFIKDVTGKPFIGQVWPGAVNWPDFRDPKAIKWWQGQMAGLHDKIEYDGLWLDMNEVSNYCSGDVCQDPGPSVGVQLNFVCQVSCASGPETATNSSGGRPANAADIPSDSIFNPPYAINNGNQQLVLGTKSLPVTAVHHDGEIEYNLHNLYGLYEVIASYRQLITMRQRRPFILTRSTWLGSGAYAAHWTGDTLSSEADMQWSVPSILNQGIAGITFVGADICGFSQYASENLCARWAALGAWYPYSRNHHADGFQEFYRWPKVAEIARKAYSWRMRAMPYLYTSFFDSHQYGCPVARPMFYTFPGDQATWNSNTQFMIGDGLLVAPVLSENGTTADVYYPRGTWYSLYDSSVTDASDRSTNKTLEVGITDDVPLFLLGGTIMTLSAGGMTTDAARNGSLTIVVALPSNANASGASLCGKTCPTGANGSITACGHMYLDEGEDLELGAALDNYVTFTAETEGGGGTGHLDIQFTGNPLAGEDAGCTAGISWPSIESIRIMGVASVDTSSVTTQSLTTAAPAAGAVSTASISTAASNLGVPQAAGQAEYAANTRTLTVDDLNIQLNCPDGIRVSWNADGTSAVQTAG